MITPRKYNPDTDPVDEGFYTSQRILAEDIFSSDRSGFRYHGHDLTTLADAFLVHFAFSGDPIDGHLANLAQSLEMEGVPLLNEVAYTWLRGDKFLALQRARRLGLATPHSLLARPTREGLRDLVEEIERDFRYPVVLKPRGTMMAFGVLKVSDPEQLVSILQLYAASDLSCLIQEFVATDGREVRCLFAGGGLIGAYERRTAGFLTNTTHRAGRPTDVIVTRLPTDAPDVAQLVKESETLLAGPRWDFAAVDWFAHADGYVFNEINPLPGTLSIPPADMQEFDRCVAKAIRAAAARSASPRSPETRGRDTEISRT